MKKNVFFSLLAVVVLFSMIIFSGCSNVTTTTQTTANASSQTTSSTTQVGTETTKGTTETTPVTPQKVTLYPYNAGLQSGPVSGWVNEFLQANGVSLEVIPFSAEKTQAMLSSGDLPDVIIFNNKTDALAAMEAGMLMNLDDKLGQLPSITGNTLFGPAIQYSRNLYSNNTGALYFIPFSVGKNTLAAVPDSERYAIKFNFPVYKEIGAPSFDTLEDVIPILSQMKEIYPTNEEGVPAYGMSMFSDYDTAYFYNMINVFSLLGYDSNYLKYGIEYDVKTNTGYSIFRENSLYKRGATFFYKLNKAGLLDPDSLNQQRTTVNNKMDTKAALAGWPSAPAWESKNFYPVSFGEFTPTLQFGTPYGNIGVAVNAKANNVDACLKLIDMLADPEALITLYNGPQGDRWDIEDGKLVLTEKFKTYYTNGGGTYTLESGEQFSIFNIVSYVYGTGNVIEKYGEVFPMTLWKEYMAMQYATPTAKDWSEQYQYPYLKAQLEAENRLTAIVDSSFSAFLSQDSDDLKLTLAALKQVIVPGTWELVYAKDEAEFESIWASLKAKCEDLDIQKVIDDKLADINNAKAIADTYK